MLDPTFEPLVAPLVAPFTDSQAAWVIFMYILTVYAWVLIDLFDQIEKTPTPSDTH